MQAVLKGVAFTFADALAASTPPARASAPSASSAAAPAAPCGAGSSRACIGIPLRRYAGGETGPAFGAARLARLALGSDDPAAVLAEPAFAEVIEPDPSLTDA